MAVTSIGTPTLVRSTTSPSGSVTASFGTGQTPLVGDLIVAVVNAAAATSVTATASSSTGWSKLLESTNTASTPHCAVALWTKIAVGSDAAPVFTSTLSGTGAMAAVLYILRGANLVSLTDTTGTEASGSASATIASTAVTTGANVTTAGEFAILAATRERAAGAPTITASSGWTLDANDGATSSVSHLSAASQAGPATGATLSGTITYTTGTNTTAFGAGVLAVFNAATSGPVLPPLSGPPGVRLIWVRAGLAVASLIGAAATPPPPFVQAPLTPLAGPVRARLPRLARNAGRTYSNTGAPVHNPTAGPAFRLPPQPAGARIPQTFSKGRRQALQGTSPANPTPGPVFRQATSPVRARLPQLQPRAGRALGSQVTPPVAVFTAAQFYPLNRPAGARRQIVLPGRVAAMDLLPPQAQPAAGPPLTPPTGPARARQPLPARGRATSSKGSPVQNPAPSAGPPFYPFRQPVRARQPLPPRGQRHTRAGAPAANPTPGPRVYPLTGPVRERLPVPGPRAGRAYGSPGAPARNPGTGPALRPLAQPVRARQATPAGGRAVTVRAIAPPPVTPAPVYLLHQPVAARGPRVIPGRAGTMALLPPALGPALGPPFALPSQPARSRQPLPPRGRTAGNKGAPVNNPAVNAGPPFYPFRQPARSRIAPPPRGHVLPGTGAPVRNPTAGPPFKVPTQAIRARQPLPPRGRATGNRGAPVQNPAPPPPAFRALSAPVRARLGQIPELAGRAATMAVLPVPVQPFTQAPVYPLTGPVKARQPLPPRGHASGNPGAPVVHQGPAFRQAAQPARARIPQTWSKGRATGNVGAPVVSPTAAQLRPLNKALRAQPPVFLKGRIASSPGAPVRNPTRGPAPFPLHQPVKARQPYPAPGRGFAGGKGTFSPFVPPIPPPLHLPGVLTITPAGAQTAVVTIAPAGAQAAVLTLIPAGTQTAALAAATPGTSRPATWPPPPAVTWPAARPESEEPAPPLVYPPSF